MLHSGQFQSLPGCHHYCRLARIHTHTVLWHCCSNAKLDNWCQWPTLNTAVAPSYPRHRDLNLYLVLTTELSYIIKNATQIIYVFILMYVNFPFPSTGLLNVAEVVNIVCFPSDSKTEATFCGV